jgi:hypothetical protein
MVSGPSGSDVVDIYNITTRSWTTARLSQARVMFNAATSVGNVALFAGGSATEGAADAALHQLTQLYRRLIVFDTLCCLFFLNGFTRFCLCC